MTKPRVFVTRIIPKKGLDLIQDSCDTDIWQDELPPPREALMEHMRGAEGLLCLLTDRIDGEVMDAAGGTLRVISNHAVGFDNVDVAAATLRGIPVGNTPGILTEATADFAFLLMMAAGRRLVEADHYVRAGRWKTWGPSLLLGTDFKGATLGLVGFGRIGQAMARRAAGFDMHVIYYDPLASGFDTENAGRAESLDALLARADFVSLHTPLNDQTYHLIDAAALLKMKPNAVLINTSRGPVVDMDALYEALRSRRIFAAALDVTEPEPLPPDHPLFALDNLIISPHIASASRTTREKMASMAAHNLLAGLGGERLPICVNPEVYAKPGR
jgi:lactate dehydrogenase-like 2-hydroxyacid dehydrogenase